MPLARHQLCRLLRAARFSPEQVDDAALMVSELVANAVTHAKSPYELRVVRHGELMECQVTDGSPSPVRFPHAPATVGAVAVLPECGRGLVIVNALSGGRCGCRPARLGPTAEPGKAVYFALRWPAEK